MSKKIGVKCDEETLHWVYDRSSHTYLAVLSSYPNSLALDTLEEAYIIKKEKNSLLRTAYFFHVKSHSIQTALT